MFEKSCHALAGNTLSSSLEFAVKPFVRESVSGWMSL